MIMNKDQGVVFMVRRLELKPVVFITVMIGQVLASSSCLHRL